MVVGLILAGGSSRGLASEPACVAARGAPAAEAAPVRVIGLTPVTTQLPVVSRHTYLVEVAERGNDALIEILDSRQQVTTSADHPERRSGTRRALTVADGPTLTIRIAGKEHPKVSGTATVRIFDVTALSDHPECQTIFRELAQADADDAAGQRISRGLATGGTAESARDDFLRAAAGYAAAERALKGPGNAALRGEAALALASLAYFDLDDWAQTLDWSIKATQALEGADPYRRARAQALTAAAWLEMGVSSPAGAGAGPSDLLTRAREEMQRLVRFHLARGERYDAGQQLTNIGLTYLHGGQYGKCIRAVTASAELFGEIGESQRQAQAWQNRALCLWGLGRMHEALVWFHRALEYIGPQSYPSFYLTLLNNTALVEYTVGHFDDSLRRYDTTLQFARQVQAKRYEAAALYGIGLNYYALGDRERARRFLEPALEIRTVALDRRGRTATLRALATLDADEGRLQDALTADREALQLALAPSTAQRIRVQLAAHLAAAGDSDEARRMLDQLLADHDTDALIRAEARLQRGVLLHQLHELDAARTDLEAARRSLHRLGSVQEEFAACLELTRTLIDAADSKAARSVLEEALKLADAVRLQSANPELRSGLQAPLRAAYDLNIELLRTGYELAVSQQRQADAERLAQAAFLAADASRARSLEDVAAAEYSPAMRREFATDLARREQLYREIAARRFLLEDRADRLGADDPRARHLLAEIAELKRETDTISTRLALRAQPRGRSGSAPGGVLPPVPVGTALVSYWLGSRAAYAWVITAGTLTWTRLGPSGPIDAQALDFYRALTRLIDTPSELRLAKSRSLAGLILSPLWLQLGGAPRWIVIPDGALNYVPFAALSGSEGFIARQHDVALTPAAWRLGLHPPASTRPGTQSLLIVADPVYQVDDPRLAGLNPTPPPETLLPPTAGLSGHGYQRLPFSAREAHGVLQQFAPENAEQLIGLKATRERFLALDLSRYRYIHVATHGVADAQVPELSALIFGLYDSSGRPVDGAVRVADLALLRLNADVAVFSACDTALGKEVPSEGLVGISSTVLARGARAVVASLWQVSDEMSAKLMTDFYRHLRHDSMSAPEALGAAMRGVLARDGSSDPSLWAAFQVYIAALADLPPRAVEPSRLQSRQGEDKP
jgi:CHAT domain-containing protein/tetratricopeptide (TPR) repeat protein